MADKATLELIENHVKNHKIFVYMKGTPEAPMCGFSAACVSVFQRMGVPFKTFNVLENEAVRQGIKEYANWPTIPQVYINGQFVGGNDIIQELYRTGELQKLINA